ncbi:MAG TPA: alpha/beta fold hydrolase [Alphaproteobacteria bacterium]|nr:alpha/beta fold hydrolase [Alphaproteobacteria bacterium]
MPRTIKHAALSLVFALIPSSIVPAGSFFQGSLQKFSADTNQILGEEHYANREGLRIYLWEKHKAGLEGTFAASGKVALLVHGGTFSGRPDFDLQIRDYSLMDFLAKNNYDVWAIDIHGYGHSDKTNKDWSGVQSAAADITAAVEYITKLRGVSKVDLLGWSGGTQRAGLFAMQHPDKVARLILYAPHWKGTADYRNGVQKKIENGGQPLTQYRINTEAAARGDFTAGELAQHPQYEEDVVALYAREALKTDPQSPNAFVDNAHLPILDPQQITVPTMIIHGERDYAAKEEDLVPFFSQLKTRDKQYILLPDGGHSLILEKDHRRFQHEVLSFFDRP